MSKTFLDHSTAPCPSIYHMISGEHAVSTDLFAVSEPVRDQVAGVLQEYNDSDGQDEFLDLLDRLGVKLVPS